MTNVDISGMSLDYCLAVLADGKGAAFVPTPSAGQIGPFEQIVIEVTAFMDMWGEYNDNLLCMVSLTMQLYHAEYVR